MLKSHTACNFVNLLVDRLNSPHFYVFVISLQVDLDLIALTLEVKLDGRMAGGRAWQLRLGHVGRPNRGEGGSSWRRSFTSSPQTIRMSKKSSSISKLIHALKLFESSKVCLSWKLLQIFKSVTPKLT